MRAWLAAQRYRQERMQLQLVALSPLAVLKRGYALVQTVDGAIVRDAARLAQGEVVYTRVSAGGLISRVEQIYPDTESMTEAVRSTLAPTKKRKRTGKTR